MGEVWTSNDSVGANPFFASSLQSLCWELNESLEQTFKSAVPLIRYDFKGCSSGCPLFAAGLSVSASKSAHALKLSSAD